jgi:hypothetical protein
MDAVLEEERERRKPPPPPISAAHGTIRDRIERAMGALHEQIPEGTDLEEAMEQSPELADLSLQILVLAREEHAFLASQGVDPRPYARY